MRDAYRAAAVLAWLALTVGGCAAISGLSGITEEACAPDCDGGTGRADAMTMNHVDAPATGQDTSPPPSDDAPTSVPETGSDAPVGSCGPLDTVANCSACGDTCASTDGSTPTCTGSTCTYTCATGYLDCNASTAPDLDGCECQAPATTACCGADCPFAHNYNEDLAPPAVFYDCVASGTYNATLAMDACAAFTGDKTQCNYAPPGEVASFTCMTMEDGGPVGSMVCSNGPNASVCDCWGYSGIVQGVMSTGSGKGDSACQCPPPSGGTQWN